MLSALTRDFRVKAAITLAALYALCILGPSAAFAFSHNPSAAHCLTEDGLTSAAHDHGGTVHVHTDGTTHRHHGDGSTRQHHDDGSSTHKHSSGGAKDGVATCCSLFSVVAVAFEPALILGLSGPASLLVPTLREALSGRGPERINRPPIA
jgi:hypothetical protein